MWPMGCVAAYRIEEAGGGVGGRVPLSMSPLDLKTLGDAILPVRTCRRRGSVL
jgi:hypothetical protein